jgi:hypothetical protein
MLFPVILLGLAGAAYSDPGDPPARVARLNYVSGAVSFRPSNVEEWAAATLNYPMTTGDHLWTDDGAGAEMHVGSTAVRMAGLTAVEFLNLDDQVAQLSLQQGGLNVRLRNLEGDQTFEIDTPHGAILLLRAGEYRVDVNPDDNTTFVTVRSGEAEISGAGNPFRVYAQQMARLSGEPAAAEMNAARAPDGWDRWCMDRDRHEDNEAAASAAYVPREMVGYEDLGSYGVWREEAEYGIVWAPRVSIGWAPYHYGRWVWVQPWGWTWVDDAPWGFAPFHYGRWAYVRGAWVWLPGAVAARPVYAPHLAVFVGTGSAVAWFPLGPREVFVPSYHVSPAYVRRVNVTHVTNVNTITNVTNVRYVNRTVTGAVTAVPHGAFAGARPVAQAAVSVSAQDVSRAQVLRTAPAAPSREAMLGRAPGGRVMMPPARVQNREVLVKTTPAEAAAPRVRQIRPEPRPVEVMRPGMERPARAQGIEEPRGNRPPAPVDRPARVDRPPQVERPPRVERPVQAERPPQVQQAPQVERPPHVERPARVERPPQAEQPPQMQQRPQVAQPPQVERPPRVERPPQVERPARVERPPQVERPARVERPAESPRPAPPEVRREAQQERRQEKRAEHEERRPQNHESRKDEKKDK